jgi:hypothetical protein
VALPETSYKEIGAFIITKNSSYKGLINWRWDNKIKSIRHITDKSRLLWVPRKSLNIECHVCLLLVIRNLITGMCECFVTFLTIVVCFWTSLYFSNWEFCLIGNLLTKEGSVTAIYISDKTYVETIRAYWL